MTDERYEQQAEELEDLGFEAGDEETWRALAVEAGCHEPALRLVDVALDELYGRSGYEDLWDTLDDDVRDELRVALARRFHAALADHQTITNLVQDTRDP